MYILERIKFKVKLMYKNKLNFFVVKFYVCYCIKNMNFYV